MIKSEGLSSAGCGALTEGSGGCHETRNGHNGTSGGVSANVPSAGGGEARSEGRDDLLFEFGWAEVLEGELERLGRGMVERIT